MKAESVELDQPSEATLRAARRLTRRKERKAAGMFLVEGPQAIREALKVPGIVECVFVRWGLARDNLEIIEQARAAHVQVYGVSEQNLATLTDTVTPQGIVALVQQVDVPLEVALRSARLAVICAQVRDPGNAGTVIRCADAFGADLVVLSSDSVELYNPKTVRASVGSVFHLPIVVGVGLDEAVNACRAAGLQILATDGDASVLLTGSEVDLTKPTAWVMGNEAWGLPPEHARLADQTVAVPLYGKAESLNLATAAAVCLFASATAQHA